MRTELGVRSYRTCPGDGVEGYRASAIMAGRGGCRGIVTIVGVVTCGLCGVCGVLLGEVWL